MGARKGPPPAARDNVYGSYFSLRLSTGKHAIHGSRTAPSWEDDVFENEARDGGGATERPLMRLRRGARERAASRAEAGRFRHHQSGQIDADHRAGPAETAPRAA